MTRPTPRVAFACAEFSRSSDGTYVAEASDLGWPPGQHAHSISLDAEVLVYVSTDKTSDGEDVAGWRYASNRRRALVIND